MHMNNFDLLTNIIKTQLDKDSSKTVIIDFDFFGGRVNFSTDIYNISGITNNAKSFIITIDPDEYDRSQMELCIEFNKRETKIEYTEEDECYCFILKNVGVTGLVNNQELMLTIER